MASSATAVTSLLTLSAPDALLPLPTWREVSDCSSEDAIIALLVSRRLLLPLDRICPRCRVHHLRASNDKRYIDNMRLRCSRCSTDYTLRHGSVFAGRKQALADITRELSLIEQHIYIAAASKLHGICYSSSSSLYHRVRECVFYYMLYNPVVFAPNDIVELDECYLKSLNKEKDQEKQVWIIGMIARGSGRVALALAMGHTKEEMRRVIAPHLPHSSTITISDRHQSFNFLEEDREHFWAIKKKSKHGMWVVVEDVSLFDRFGPGYGETRFNLHTNTIEGFWSHFRKELIGYQVETLHLYLAETMFRRENIPLSHTLAPSPL
jgi:transposase-like protein